MNKLETPQSRSVFYDHISNDELSFYSSIMDSEDIAKCLRIMSVRKPANDVREAVCTLFAKLCEAMPVIERMEHLQSVSIEASKNCSRIVFVCEVKDENGNAMCIGKDGKLTGRDQ